MTLENFLLYTELDPNNHITRTANTLTHEAYRDENAYLYDDKGVDYFGTEFIHYLEMTPISYTDVGPLPPIGRGWTIQNSNEVLARPRLHLLWYEQYDLPKLELAESRSAGTVFYHSIGLSWGTKYYMTIVRDATTLKCHIYSDALRSVLVETMSINLVLTNQKYRYIYACWTANMGYAYMLEHKVENLFLGVESETSGGTFISLGSGGSIDFKPISWKESQECDVAIRPVPLRSGPKVDTSTWILDTREIIIKVRFSDAEKTILQTIFDTGERVMIVMGTGWSYSGWLRGKPVKYEYKVVDGTVKPWLYELKLDCEIFNYNP